jgi:diguanylate cyclase (GGDEF)-like protein
VRHLQALLALGPLHVFAAESSAGTVPAAIAGFDLGDHEIIDAATALGRIGARDRAVAASAWARAQAVGMTADDVELIDGSRAIVSLFDFRDLGGVFIGVAVPACPIHQGSLSLPVEPIPTRVARLSVDADARVLTVGDDLQELLGLPGRDVRGLRSLDRVHPEDHAAGIGVWAAVLTSPGRPHRVRHRQQRGDGRWMWCESTLVNRLDDPDFPRIDVEVLDVSAEMETHEAVRIREQQLERLAESLPVGVLQLDGDHRVVYANPMAFRLLGPDASLACLIARTVDADRPALLDAIDGALGAGEDREVEVRVHEHAIYEITLRAIDSELGIGARAGTVCCISDVTERALQRHRLEMLASVDGLTCTYNRDATVHALANALGDRSGDAVAVVFIDLDGFKRVNDEHGHGVGDQLLATIADRLRAAVRQEDVVGRIGGDEFLVVCPRITRLSTAQQLAGRIAHTLAAPAEVGGVVLFPQASIGLACSWDQAEEAEAVIARADAAMYDVKRDRAGPAGRTGASQEQTRAHR